MKKIFNIAFIPMLRSNSFIVLANKLKSIADQYLLGDESFPHVTLCQFIKEEGELATLWANVCDALNQKTIDVVFKGFSCITFNSDIFWISLLPEDGDKLTEIHHVIADLVKNPINKSYADYDPHMTLLNTKNKECEQIIEKIKRTYHPIPDKFVLSLGNSDNIGQYKKIIYRYEF